MFPTLTSSFLGNTWPKSVSAGVAEDQMSSIDPGGPGPDAIIYFPELEL